MDDVTDKLYTAIDLDERRQLRVARVLFGSSVLYHVREFYLIDGGEYRPGRGIAVKPEHVSRVRLALQLAEEDMAT